MNSLLLYIKKLPDYLAYPIIILSSYLLLINAFKMISVNFPIPDYASMLFGILVNGFVVLYETNSGKKAMTAVYCFALGDMTFFSFSGVHLGYVVSISIAFVSLVIIKKLDYVYSHICLVVLSLIISISLGFMHPYLSDFLRIIARTISDKPSVFGALNDAYSAFFGDTFAELFYHKEYSSTSIIDGKIYSGVIDIFSHSTDAPKRSVSAYLTGKYFVNVFCVGGAFLALYNRLNKRGKIGMILLLSLSIIFGDSVLFSLLILCFNPVLYIGYLFVIFVSYLTSHLLDLRIGFTDYASLLSLIKYGNRWLYFIISGLIITALTYFMMNLIISKFNLTQKRLIPRQVKNIFSYLGGEKNIERVNGSDLIVKNPNLINVLKLDCEIHGSRITLLKEDMELLKEFL